MPTPELRPPADHESADVRVVAPVNADQRGGTSKERFWIAILYFFGIPAFLAFVYWLYLLSPFWFVAGFVALAWFCLSWFLAGVVTGDVEPHV